MIMLPFSLVAEKICLKIPKIKSLLE